MTGKIINLYLIVNLILLVFFEIISTVFPRTGQYAALFWMLSFLPIIGYSIGNATYLFKGLLRFKFAFTLCFLFLLFFIVLIGIPDPRNSNFETTQEVSCTLDQLYVKTGGYNSTCFFGYPTRQYYIPSLPSLVFGRNLVSLNIGGSIYIFTGILLFSGALVKFLRSKIHRDIVGATILSMLPHFYYFNHFLLAYEQSIFPLSFSLMLVGLFLDTVKRFSIGRVLITCIVLYHVAFLYTPALSIIVLSIGACAYLLVKDIKTKLNTVYFLPIVIAVFAVFSSYFIRHDIKIAGNNSTIMSVTSDIYEGTQHILFGKYDNLFVSPVISTIFLLVIFSPLLLTFGRRLFLISLWIIFVLIISVISKGYAYYTIDFRFHRAMVIIPVFLATCAYLANKFLDRIDKINFIIVVFFIIFLSGITNITLYQISKTGGERHRHYEFIMWAKDHIPKSSLKNTTFLFNAVDNARFVSINDSLLYYLPGTKAQSPAFDCKILEDVYEQNNSVVLMTNRNELCESDKLSIPKYLGVFRFRSDEKLYSYIYKK